MKLLKCLAAGLLAVSVSAQAAPVQVDGAGSSFIYPLFSQWALTWHGDSGDKLNYQSIGSGGGIRQIIKGTVDFAASDAPLDEAQLEEHDLIQFPLVMGGVIPTINVPGIEANQLKLDGQTLAAIFSGKITTWNDKRIATLNPGLKLPDLRISVVHRADGSGTTWIFTNYLSKVGKTWGADIGSAKAIDWPTGFGAKGNEGVANYVGRIKGSIGYIELAYVLHNHMTSVKLKNRAGNFVAPTLDTLKAAAAGADWDSVPGMAVVLTDQPGANSWPITGATFVLLHQPIDSDLNNNLREFFDWAWRHGSKKAEALSYVPLPLSLVDKIQAGFKADSD